MRKCISQRKKKDKWSKALVSVWYPREGKRRKGRQNKRWRDEIKAIARRTWMRRAANRNDWKGLEEAFAKEHTD
ncbi:unnamed protein product [Euphydryas editha]|uniref:Endonuclease-reverse transcriptase n=1 Tax=Euphydryas editha TaxID=104508 RepID=A0AAU9TZS2_EUPED|nr:unnamed protein product [Euphydryas editha]